MAKNKYQRQWAMGFLLVLVVALFGMPLAWARELCILESAGQAGGIVQVPVFLDDATEVASAKVQINYDARLLSLVSVANPTGTLGGAFSLQYEDDASRAILILYREDHLLSGSGVLAYLNFLVNTGAVAGARSELVVADFVLGNERGKDLGALSALATSNSSFWVVMSALIDSDGDGISDYDEQRYNHSFDYDPYNAVTNPGGRDLDVHNPDSDGDGVRDGVEILAGTDPLAPEDHLTMLGVQQAGEMLVLSWKSVAGRTNYWVQRSTDLLSPTNWQTIAGPVSATSSASSLVDTNKFDRVFYRIVIP